MDRPEGWPWQRVPESPDSADVAHWIEREFIGWFVREAQPKHWPTANDEGVFAITLLCLAHCTAAAGLANGTRDAKSWQCIEFIRTFFRTAPAPSGERYDARAAALYTLFRHGLAHQKVPGALDACDGRTLGWILDRQGDRSLHLYLMPPVLYSTKTGNSDGHHRLRVHADLLFEDCVHAFGAMQQKASIDPAFATKVFAGAAQAVAPRPVPRSILQQLKDALANPDAY
jgi:hypothetical protein